MSPLGWIIGGLLFMGVVLFALGLCRAAGRADRAIEARDELAGPRERRRVGL